MTHQLLVRDAMLVDGTGLPARRADIAVDDGRVTAIGRLGGVAASRTIDVEGALVTPGIVDVHTHYDPQLTFEPYATPSVHHGVTSVVAGNCGFSIAPTHEADRAFMAAFFAKVEGMSADVIETMPWDFETFPEYLQAREGRLGVNLACYVGHSAVRRWVMGDQASERTATADEVERMRGVVGEAMRAGAAGFSSSYADAHNDHQQRPIPSRLGTRDELFALAGEVGAAGAGTIAFLPATVLGGLSREDQDLMIELAQVTGRPVVTQGLGGKSKVDAPDDAPALRAYFDRVREAAAPVFSLLRVAPFDRPFRLSDRQRTSNYDGVPAWREMLALAPADKLAALRDEEVRARLRRAVEQPNTDPARGSTLVPPPWDRVLVQEVRDERHRGLCGRSIADLAAEAGVAPADAMLDLALEEDLETVFRWHDENEGWEESVAEWQRHPNMLPGVSDGGAHLDRDDGSGWSTYFLATWARDRGRWSIEDAVARVTAMPAALCELPDVGLVRPGYAADLVVMDVDALGLGDKRLVPDFPGGAARYQELPLGISHTVVGGRVVVDHGELTGELPGRVLRPGPTGSG